MKKKKSSLQIWAEYIAARIFAGTLHILPLSIAAFIGKCVGILFFKIDKRHRLQCVKAMKKSLGIADAEALSLTREMYIHLGIMLAEFPRIPKLNGKFLDAHTDFSEKEKPIRDVLDKGKGVIFITGHIGNWEACGNSFAAKNITAGAIARPLDNPLINAWVKNIRQANGQEIWDKFGAMRNALRALKKGQAFGTLMDIDGGQDGLFNTFFGQSCSTVPTAADLAIKTGAPLMVAVFHRIKPMQFTLEIGEPFYYNPENEKSSERKILLQKCNDELERVIRKRPEQWLWLHRRWKTQPKEKRGDNG